MKQWIALITVFALLAACAASNDSDTPDGVTNTTLPAPVTSGNWYKPKPSTTWQWQLQVPQGQTLNTQYDVEIYDIDLFETSTDTITALHGVGRKVICYFSAGSWEDFRTDASDFDTADIGNPLDGWPGEKWLDVRSDKVRQIMQTRLDLAVTKGCDGVEPDNMDGYHNNPGFDYTITDQLDYNVFIANESHKRNLSVGLKNDLDQIAQLLDYYDFTVNEQCFEYDECDTLMPFINAGKAVLHTEYAARFVTDPTDMCADSVNRKFSTLVLPLALDDSTRYSCL